MVRGGHPGWVIAAIFLLGTLGAVARARGEVDGVISEVLTGPATTADGSLPGYVEVTLPGSGLFDLLVLEASPNRNPWRVYAVVHLDAANGPVQVIADSAGFDAAAWPTNVSLPTTTAPLQLYFARSLVLFRGSTGLEVGDIEDPMVNNESQVVDAVTLSLKKANAADFPVDNHTFTLAAGDALWRHREDSQFTETYSTGPLAPDTLTFADDGQAMDPGLANLDTDSTLTTTGITEVGRFAIPEPASGLMVLGGVLGSGVRARRRF